METRVIDFEKKNRIEEDLKEFDFGEKINLCTYREPSFFIEHVRGSAYNIKRITIDHKKIVVSTPASENTVSIEEYKDETLISKIIKYIFNNRKKLLDLSIKLNDEYISKYGKENSYTNRAIIKIDNAIFIIDSGSVYDKGARKILDYIYNNVIKE